MTPTPLLTRIEERRKPQEPEPIRITERMSPFARKLAAKNLAPKDMSGRTFQPWGGDAA